MDFVYKKISKNTYHLISNNPIKLDLPTSYVPFGLDDKNNKFVICFSINNKSQEGLELLDVIDEVEKYFQGLDFIVDTDKEKIMFSNKQFVSNIKQNQNFYPIFRTHIKKINNQFNTKVIKNNSLGTIYDIKSKMKCNGVIELGSLWYNDTTYGLLWYINEITLLN
jgi:hypothetical protein